MTIPASGSSVAAPPPLHRATKFVELVLPKLQQTEALLERNFSSPVRTVREVGQHLLEGGGKRIRPTLLLLVADLVGYQGTKDVTYAAVIEFIHTATLVHDDIIDEAAVRRGRASVNYQWGNHLTVLVGDFLYTHAMQMALREGSLEILDLLSTTTIEMIEGEILGLEQKGRADVSVDEYFEIIQRKTAGLFGATCRIPGILVDAPESLATALHDYGYNLGICFQLVDDLLDFTSTTEVLGKPALSDLKEGKLTLPLILAMPQATASEREAITHIARDGSFGTIDPSEVIGIATRYGTIEQTREIAREYADRARTAVSLFKPGLSRDALELALDFVISRDR